MMGEFWDKLSIRRAEPWKRLNYISWFRTFIDATEQEIPRPKNKGRRKSYYSGKRRGM